MGIDPIKFKKLNQMQNIQKMQAAQAGQSSKSQETGKAAGGGSLMDRLNGMDNKLNQGGGVSLTDSAAGQSGGIDALLKKRKFM